MLEATCSGSCRYRVYSCRYRGTHVSKRAGRPQT